ncbi:MAG: Flp pilus assembly complex ATPase component TadA, partial [Candidatus Pacebacteria bacterium]|nr:Flp pilus assembly complex ATPase component TadA [Candidatus Paceibacterota bacterium]
MDPKKELEDLILTVIREGGSDLHISASRYPAIRVTGELIFLVKKKVFENEEVIEMLRELVGSDENVKKFLENKEIDFSYAFKEEARLRGNAFFQKGKIGIALRLIPKVRSLSELNLPPILETYARKKQGFFLVVGPVGQGKSTTLASMVNLINQERAEHIVTIEDPMEYIFEPQRSIIDQREVGIDTEDFQTGLRSAFRQDVNVLMIGEMRSPETMAAAVT